MTLATPPVKIHGNCFHSTPMPVKFNKPMKLLIKITSTAHTKQLEKSNRFVTGFIFNYFTTICQPVPLDYDQTRLNVYTHT